MNFEFALKSPELKLKLKGIYKSEAFKYYIDIFNFNFN